ncbi:MAG: hypothetical protein M3Y91_17290 [Actinomycetota bacterium]|nr:hypothetical protein [Actinomycetota bacterium]
MPTSAGFRIFALLHLLCAELASLEKRIAPVGACSTSTSSSSSGCT